MKKILLSFIILLLNIGCETKKEETKSELILTKYTTLFAVDLFNGKGNLVKFLWIMLATQRVIKLSWIK
ncbi:MAG: hypothetical protein ACKOWQ_01265 [Aquirufa sp.]